MKRGLLPTVVVIVVCSTVLIAPAGAQPLAQEPGAPPNPLQHVIDFVTQNSGVILSVLTIILYTLKDYSVLKQLLTSIFLDVEKRFAEQATAGGHEKIEAAVQDALNLIPKRFDIALSILALVLRTTREQLAHTIAQFIYDRVRTQAQASARIG